MIPIVQNNPPIPLNGDPVALLAQVLPVLFVIVIVLAALSVLERGLDHVPSSKANATTGIKLPENIPPRIEVPAWNCLECGGPNPRGTELCEYCGKAKGFWDHR